MVIGLVVAAIATSDIFSTRGPSTHDQTASYQTPPPRQSAAQPAAQGTPAAAPAKPGPAAPPEPSLLNLLYDASPDVVFQRAKLAHDAGMLVTAELLLLGLAKRKHGPSMARLAEMYLDPDSYLRDVGQAVNWAERAAAAGEPLGKLMASMLIVAERMKGSYQRAQLLAREAAEAGVPRAQGFLGGMLLDNSFSGGTKETAEAWLRKASALFDPHGLYRYGSALMGRAETAEQRERALDYLLVAANEESGARREIARAYWRKAVAARDPAELSLSLPRGTDLHAFWAAYWSSSRFPDRTPEEVALNEKARARIGPDATGRLDTLVDLVHPAQVGKYRFVFMRTFAEQKRLLTAIDTWKAGEREQAMAAWRELARRRSPRAMNILASRMENDTSRPPEDAADYYIRAAGFGHPLAYYNLASMYLNGAFDGPDPVTAHRLFSKAAENGDAEAMLALGRMHELGEGVPMDPLMGYIWYNRAAALGNEAAEAESDRLDKRLSAAHRRAARIIQYWNYDGRARVFRSDWPWEQRLIDAALRSGNARYADWARPLLERLMRTETSATLLYLAGYAAEAGGDAKAAGELFALGAAQGDAASAAAAAGTMTDAYYANGTKKEFDRVQGYLALAAKDLNPKAMAALAFSMSSDNRYRAKDTATFLALSDHAARLGNLAALNDLAEAYETGDPVEPDLFQARHLYEIGARRRDPWMAYKFAEFLEKGRGGPVETENAAEWYRKAAAKGETKAQYALGEMLLAGRGINIDTKQGIEWLLKAAENGLASAQYRLGRLYQEGKIVTRRMDRAFYFLTQAAVQRHREALVAAGRLMTSDAGVPKDPITAYAYFRIAEQMYHPESAALAQAVYETLSPDMKRLADEKLEEFLK